MDTRSVARRKRRVKAGVAVVSGNAAVARLVSIVRSGRKKEAEAKRRNVAAVRNDEGAVRKVKIVDSEADTEAHTRDRNLEVPCVERWEYHMV